MASLTRRKDGSWYDHNGEEVPMAATIDRDDAKVQLHNEQKATEGRPEWLKEATKSLPPIAKYEKIWDIRHQEFTCQGCYATFDENGLFLSNSSCVFPDSKKCPLPDDHPSPTPIPEDGPLGKRLTPEEYEARLREDLGYKPGGRAPRTRTEDRYIELFDILDEAFEYASKGKGEKRHGGGGTRWADQRHAAITKEVGLGFALGQAVKKAYESQRLSPDDARRELLGAITYIASAVYGLDKGWRK